MKVRLMVLLLVLILVLQGFVVAQAQQEGMPILDFEHHNRLPAIYNGPAFPPCDCTPDDSECICALGVQ